MILRHMIDIDETLKSTQSQGHILLQSTFGSMKMCFCVKQARLTYLRGVNVLVKVCAGFIKLRLVGLPETLCFVCLPLVPPPHTHPDMTLEVYLLKF